MYSLA